MSTYKVFPESIHPCSRKNRDIYWRRSKIQETLYIEEWCLSPLQSRPTGTSNSSPGVTCTVQNTLQNPLMEAPSASPSYFPEYCGWSSISFLSEMILVWEKARSHRAPIWAVGGLSHLGHLVFCHKLLHETWWKSSHVIVMNLPMTSSP